MPIETGILMPLLQNRFYALLGGRENIFSKQLIDLQIDWIKKQITARVEIPKDTTEIIEWFQSLSVIHRDLILCEPTVDNKSIPLMGFTGVRLIEAITELSYAQNDTAKFNLTFAYHDVVGSKLLTLEKETPVIKVTESVSTIDVSPYC
ncbi:MAG: hypothetical protein QXN55_00475 [Candidatus Nitrosotenuis sp.]